MLNVVVSIKYSSLFYVYLLCSSFTELLKDLSDNPTPLFLVTLSKRIFLFLSIFFLFHSFCCIRLWPRTKIRNAFALLTNEWTNEQTSKRTNKKKETNKQTKWTSKRKNKQKERNDQINERINKQTSERTNKKKERNKHTNKRTNERKNKRTNKKRKKKNTESFP